jgi:exopolysaccharide production protein ExoZ
MRRDYIWGIDAIRLIAALMVALFHYTWHNRFTFQYMPFGWVGVEIFFVVSGFVIANSSQGRTWYDFSKGRVLRLYPAALCALPLSLLFLKCAPSDPSILGISTSCGRRAIFESAVLLGPIFVASAYWTLPIELGFYVIVGLVLATGKLKRIELLATALILWSLPYIFLLMANTLGLEHYSWIELGYGPINMLLLRHGVFFGLGILLYLNARQELSRLGQIMIAVALALSVMSIISRSAELTPLLAYQALDPHRWLLWQVAAAAIGTFLGLGIVGIVASVRSNHILAKNPTLCSILRVCGLITFPFYLLHESVGGSLPAALGTYHQGLSAIALAVVVAGIFAYGIARVVEPAAHLLFEKSIDEMAFRLMRGYNTLVCWREGAR